MFRKFLPTEAITSSYSNAAERLQQIKAHIAPVAQVTQLKDHIIQHDWKNTLTSAKNNIVQQVTEHPYQTGLSLVCITTPQARAKPTLVRITKYIKRHPFKATAIGVSVLAPGLVSGTILGLLGFSSAGPVAGMFCISVLWGL